MLYHLYSLFIYLFKYLVCDLLSHLSSLKFCKLEVLFFTVLISVLSWEELICKSWVTMKSEGIKFLKNAQANCELGKSLYFIYVLFTILNTGS